jgi:membrane-bound metal-dependent hydrolase YbcI (DUF457 family)
MCLGATHALSGAVTGAAVGLFALHTTITGTADLAVLTAGFATLSDLDQCGSTASRSFGLVTEVLAHVVRRVSGGHRHATHTFAFSIVFAGLAWLAGERRHDWPGRIGLFAILAVGVASGFEALHPGQRRLHFGIRWGRRRRSHHGIGYGDVIAVGGAIMVCVTGWDLILVPYAAAVGILTHIAGDELTRNGCPFFWPITDRKFHLLPGWLRFTTGTWQERRILVPLLTAALVWLVFWAAGAHIDVHTIHQYAGLVSR